MYRIAVNMQRYILFQEAEKSSETIEEGRKEAEKQFPIHRDILKQEVLQKVHQAAHISTIRPMNFTSWMSAQRTEKLGLM